MIEGTDLTQEDTARLSRLLDRVVARALKIEWFTHEDLARELRAKPASVERMVRYAREPQHGGHVVAKRRVEGGLWEYRVLPHGSAVPEGAQLAGADR